MDTNQQRLDAKCLSCGDEVDGGYFCDYVCENNFKDKQGDGVIENNYHSESFAEYRDGTGDGSTDNDLRLRKYNDLREKQRQAEIERQRRNYEDRARASKESGTY